MGPQHKTTSMCAYEACQKSTDTIANGISILLTKKRTFREGIRRDRRVGHGARTQDSLSVGSQHCSLKVGLSTLSKTTELAGMALLVG